jgi:hypothetical protein
VARLVDLLGTGGGASAAEVLPVQAMVGEDADQAAAFTAHRDGLIVAGSEAMGTAVNAVSTASGSSTFDRARAATDCAVSALRGRQKTPPIFKLIFF